MRTHVPDTQNYEGRLTGFLPVCSNMARRRRYMPCGTVLYGECQFLAPSPMVDGGSTLHPFHLVSVPVLQAPVPKARQAKDGRLMTSCSAGQPAHRFDLFRMQARTNSIVFSSSAFFWGALRSTDAASEPTCQPWQAFRLGPAPIVRSPTAQ